MSSQLQCGQEGNEMSSYTDKADLDKYMAQNLVNSRC